MTHPFEVHSGAPGKRTWWISCPAIGLHWSADGRSGRPRQFATREAAQRAADNLSFIGESLAYARIGALELADWLRHTNRHTWARKAVAKSLMARDPFGLFTAAIDFRELG